MQPGDDDDVEVRLEDQQRINQFGRLNGRMHDLEEELKAKRSQHDLLDDASNELILADDEDMIQCVLKHTHARYSCRGGTLNPLHFLLLRRRTLSRRLFSFYPLTPPPFVASATHNSYAFGECYYEVTKDQAEELLDSQKDKVAEEMGVVEEELRSITATLADLKAALYGRFGKNINLEE